MSTTKRGFEVYEDSVGDWRWRLHFNGENVASSAQGFATEEDALAEVGKVEAAVGIHHPRVPFPRDDSQLSLVSAKDMWRTWGDAGLMGLNPIFVDAEYSVPTYDYMQEVIRHSQIDKVKYRHQRKDCDDFAKAFWAETSWVYGITGVGITLDISSRHAYNVFWTMDKEQLKLWLLEPQTDRVVTKGGSAYRATKGSAII